MGNRTEINKVYFGTRHVKDFIKSFAIILVVVAFSGGICFAKTIPEFERMKSLVGEWKGTSADKMPSTVTYTLVSDNSALMERLAMSGESEMVTIVPS